VVAAGSFGGNRRRLGISSINFIQAWWPMLLVRESHRSVTTSPPVRSRRWQTGHSHSL
jgi:hypothetical protein